MPKATKSKAVTVKRDHVVTESEAFLSVLDRLSRDPAADVNKFQQILEMRERFLQNAAATASAQAFVELQNKLPVLPAKGVIPMKGAAKVNGAYPPDKIKSYYVKWEDAIETLRPLLHEHGFSLSHRINTVPPMFSTDGNGSSQQVAPGGIEITAVLLHKDGHSEHTSFALPIDVNEYRNKVQDYASTVSYGKRYTAFALLGIVGRDEADDDGAGTAGDNVSQNEADTIRDLCVDAGDPDCTKILAYVGKKFNLNLKEVSDIPAQHYDATTAALRAKIASMK